MELRSALVGRETERDALAQSIERARRGSGSLLLLCGEAGVGKTRLAEEVAAESSELVLRGAASSSGRAPYGPLVALLRSYLRAKPDGLEGESRLRPHLAILLPELGRQASSRWSRRRWRSRWSTTSRRWPPRSTSGSAWCCT